MCNQQERFYNALWSNSKVVEPSSWALWNTIMTYAQDKSEFLEIGAGNRPRIPIAGSYFLDLSARAMEALRKRDAHCTAGSADALPFPDESFDLICAFEIVEHVPDDRSVLREIGRVLKEGQRLIFSVPLHMEYWTRHDELAGHVRRYDPRELERLLLDHGLPIERFSTTLSPRNTWYRNASAFLASKFWTLGVAMEASIVLPVCCWLDRRNGVPWREDDFVDQTQRANNVILVCRKQ